MLQISVDTRAIERQLNSVAKSQLLFAAALGINDVAGQIVEAEQSALARDLDRPSTLPSAASPWRAHQSAGSPVWRVQACSG